LLAAANLPACQGVLFEQVNYTGGINANSYLFFSNVTSC
jgi:hypothetical protein